MEISNQPDFSKGLIPAVIQDYFTRNILMVGFMNEAAWKKTLQEERVTFYSRSRNTLWTKGETSGNFIHVKQVQLDCDADTILIQGIPVGPVCHTGALTCFEDRNTGTDLTFLEEIIRERKENPKDSSYTSDLFRRGINKIAQKVGEEAVELVIESKDDNKDLFLNEAADLMFHYLVLLQAKGYQLEDVLEVLRNRHK
ncbi:bifunctional phosphoribosyl-AMP cyclohydrolase/phosphoribosyl-ATP diphosphatase HisIE [Fulvivirga sedimenti]|uniref:Histidine biosynthesis bifunctional protein HisIE n=1 Tax=Fulvivirga sedimenti TaxID=2879465 RepID=A0A9X1HMZ3_9BACT|nr:bifunctional phosphoribosyl-AMP cyclohydrolase/phosphoribosyl-ATP diphosphatase HisIE [Fulvivirga sedimenti]MCA6073557.1 bifunctional phosphoribosyl-AMP cyclohydrolase/phosphoribosyl-ATP diphosphatase HisIE [Fulvivirga sedimenti]